jgi:mono/diheme cytochrome c family protein
LAAAALLLALTAARAESLPAALATLVITTCGDCHAGGAAEGGLDLDAVGFDIGAAAVRDRFVLMHDRVAKGQMPPDPADLPEAERGELLATLSAALAAADTAAIEAEGRVPLRRLNRQEYQQTLRDLLGLPLLEVADRLPEDRVRDGFNKSAEGLDFSRIQLAATLDAAEAALAAAIAPGETPRPPDHYAALATKLFSDGQTFGNREAMFFAKDGAALALNGGQLSALRRTFVQDPAIECCIFRSAYWPYYGYPHGFVARRPGVYRVRFRARAVVQHKGYTITPAEQPVPMTFRARRPSGPDVSGDVRAVGGVFDIPPEPADFETLVVLDAGQTIEYSLLGLPVPLARNVNGGPPTYRYPPFPPSGQPGVAIQALEIVGPLSPDPWPPASHSVLFGELPFRGTKPGSPLPVEVMSADPATDARRLLAAFAERAVVAPLVADELTPFIAVADAALADGAGFTRAMLTGYAAILASPHVVYLREPRGLAAAGGSEVARGSRAAADLAARLSYFLWNTRPDAALLQRARDGALADPAVLAAEADRLVADERFTRFIDNFTDYWLDLRHVRRDEPDVRLYPEYRFDDYLAESMAAESRAFVTALIRDNLPARSIVTTEFVYANDRLARHYSLPPLAGHAMRKVPLPPESPLGGLLTQAAIQRVTANGTNTSPVLRGAWVMTRLLGQPPPHPPESVPAVEPDIRGAKTIRELLARHTADASCASCHKLFDPVGFALESFDICGGWRDRYRGLDEGEPVTGIDRAGHDFAYRLAAAVDPAGSLPDGRAFADIKALKALLAADDRQLARNLLHQFTAYATGAPVRFADRPEIEAMLDATAAAGYCVGDLLRGFITSRIFRGLPPAAVAPTSQEPQS